MKLDFEDGVSVQTLKTAIEEGIESGTDYGFDPKEHLKQLKSSPRP